MDYDLVRWYNQTVYFQMNMLQMEAKMHGMIAENKQREALNQSMAYTETDFNSLAEEFGVYHNAFPCYKEG